jgi:hypothetical protein
VHQTLKISPAMAAGVTDRLWEIGDIVDMPAAWEAKEKRDVEPVFEVCEQKIGGGYYVRATLPNAAPEPIYGFATEAEAARWISNESAAWLHARRQVGRKEEVANRGGRDLIIHCFVLAQKFARCRVHKMRPATDRAFDGNKCRFRIAYIFSGPSLHVKASHRASINEGAHAATYRPPRQAP